MDKVKLLKETVVSDWLRTINAAENTKRSYLTGLCMYCEFYQMSATKLLEEAELEIEKGVLMRKRKIKTRILDFQEHLNSLKLAPLTVTTRMKSVQSFYKSNDIQIPVLQRNSVRALPQKKNQKVPTKKDIREILKIADILDKAIILVGASSGLSVNEICNLKISDFKNGLDSVTGVTMLSLRRAKTNFDFTTFLTHEATQAVNEYLIFRNRNVRVNKGTRSCLMQKQRIVNDSGYLFICKNVLDEYCATGNEELRKLSPKTVMMMYQSLSEKARLTADVGTYNLVRSHNLRKFFYNTLMFGGCNNLITEHLMGHAVSTDTATYYAVLKPENLKKEYMKFILDLTIGEEFENEALKNENNEIKKQLNDLQAIKEEILKLQASEAEWKALRNQFAPIREEATNQYKQVEEFFEMPFEEAMELYDVGRVIPPDSERMKKHHKKLKTDPKYKEIYLKYQNAKKPDTSDAIDKITKITERDKKQ